MDGAAPDDTLRSEELGQDLECALGRAVVELPKMSDQPGFVDGPKLVQRKVANLSSERHRNAPRIGAPTGGHRRHDDGAQRLVQVVWRDDRAGASLADFAASRWIELNEDHVKSSSGYHSHSSSSKIVAVGGSRRSSSRRWAISWAASAQPWRTRGAASKTILPSTTERSTASSIAHAARIAFGIRTPRELPIWTTFARMPSAPPQLSIYNVGTTRCRYSAWGAVLEEGDRVSLLVWQQVPEDPVGTLVRPVDPDQPRGRDDQVDGHVERLQRQRLDHLEIVN